MNFTNLHTIDEISKNFNIDLNFLQHMSKGFIPASMYKSDSIFNSYASIISIPKKNNKRKNEYREVLYIQSPYNIFYKELLFAIENTIKQNTLEFITDNAHGFIKGKNILSNASQHINKKYIFKVDISSFFNSINIESINNVFIKLGCSKYGAEVFSKLCTYDDVLKEGFNTSPILANLYCFDLDNDLNDLSNKYNLVFTRYSDDITFSSDTNNFPSITEIETILSKYSFKLNSDKTLLLKYGQSQYVTGLSISNKKYPRIPKNMKRKVRQDLYQLDKYFSDESFDIDCKLRYVYGKITYILGIEKQVGKKFKEKFIKILNDNDYKLTDIFKDAPSSFKNKVFHYTDESDIKINGKHYISLAVVSILSEELKEENKKILTNLKTDIATDYRNGLSQSEKENIFHYSEDKIYVKEKYQDTLRKLQFEAFIIFTKSNNENMKKEEYKESYYMIFDILMYNILRKFKNHYNYIYPEENSKITKTKLEENLSNMTGLPKIKLNFATKNEILLSIPDYILGIFRDCIKQDLTKQIKKLKNSQTITQENKLNEIVDKIRLVIDLDNKKYYARQNSNRLNCREINKDITSPLEFEVR